MSKDPFAHLNECAKNQLSDEGYHRYLIEESNAYDQLHGWIWDEIESESTKDQNCDTTVF
jgi:hypothetical protein